MGSSDGPCRNEASGAGLVLDDDRLAEDRLHAQSHKARNRVGRAARRYWHDELDGALRKGLARSRNRKTGRESGGDRCQAPEDRLVYVAHHRRILAHRWPGSSVAVGWAKARSSRRAHLDAATVGTLRFAHPTRLRQFEISYATSSSLTITPAPSS